MKMRRGVRVQDNNQNESDLRNQLRKYGISVPVHDSTQMSMKERLEASSTNEIPEMVIVYPGSVWRENDKKYEGDFTEVKIPLIDEGYASIPNTVIETEHELYQFMNNLVEMGFKNYIPFSVEVLTTMMFVDFDKQKMIFMKFQDQNREGMKTADPKWSNGGVVVPLVGLNRQVDCDELATYGMMVVVDKDVARVSLKVEDE